MLEKIINIWDKYWMLFMQGLGITLLLSLIIVIVGTLLGFLLAMVLFSGVRRRVDAAEPPKAFKGMPITLISAALVSLSFMCFAGVADNLFGVL